MAHARVPWWVYLVAAPFAAFFVFTLYLDGNQPQTVGFLAFDFAQHNLLLSKIAPGSPLEKAGVRDGDRMLSVDSHPLHNIDDWRVRRSLFRPNQPIDFEIERDGTRFHANVVLQRSPFMKASGEILSDRVNYFGWRTAELVFILSAIFLISFRPEELTVRVFSLMCATLAVSIPVVGPGYGWRASWADLPTPLALLLSLPVFGVALIPVLSFSFFATFPRDYFASRRTLIGACAPGILAAPALFLTVWPLYPLDASDLFVRIHLAAIVQGAYSIAGFAVLADNYRRLQDQNARRRVRAIIPATILVCLVGAHAFVALRWTQWFSNEPPLMFSAAGLALDAVLLFCAWSLLVYAILKHRVFEFSVIVRRTLQYATARGVLRAIVPTTVGLLVADLYLHRTQSLTVIMQERGWFYAATGVAAFVANKQRDQWMNALDKRFFRERYNAQHILHDVVEAVRAAHSLEEIAPVAVLQIESALHPDFVALMVRDAGAAEYRCIAAAPGSSSPRSFLAESKLMTAFRLFARPLHLSHSDSSWLQQLPHQDTDFLRQSKAELLVPIALGAGTREALLMLGAKKSEEPYSGEDQELLLAVANGLALLLERPAITGPGSGTAECPACGACYDSTTLSCPADSKQLKPSPAPRLLVGRYRLEKRLGSGGMGTVYRAADTSLDRDVAIKLIRDDLLANPDMLERFRREAKAAAALSHPNLVTVYDFGVDQEARAFLIMELLDGKTLREELQQRKSLSSERALHVLRPICTAVDAAHQKNVIHRDLKAENIFLARNTSGETAKILDFGLAKFAVSSDVQAEMPTIGKLDTGAGVLLGTPHYMSPEQLKGEPVSKSWDIWALSVIAYESLAGGHPFTGSAIAQIHHAISNGRFTPIVKYLPDASERLSELFVRLFSVNVSDRPASATALISELQDALQMGKGSSA